jgi:ATP-dependent DNA helicase RecQ
VLRGHATEKVAQWNHGELSVFGIGEDLSRDEWMGIFRQLIHLGYLRQDIAAYSALKLTANSGGVLRGEVPVQLAKLKPRAPKAPKAKKTSIALEGLDVDEELFERLRELRREIAAEQRVPAYVVFADRSLADMAARRPTTDEELLACHGVGAAKLERYGERFLGAIGGE